MKKILLGTTALVAAGVIGADGAEAAFEVTVRGNYTAAYGLVNEDDDPGEGGFRRQNQTLNQDVETHFRFQQTFDNGITVGGRVELEGGTHNEREPAGTTGTPPVLSRSAGSDQIDERWGYVRGGFGELRFGDEDDARKLLALYAPEASGIFVVNSPYWTFQNLAPAGQAISTNSTAAFLENDSAKVIYFTPVFGGFQFVASYTPDGTQDRSQGGTGGTQEAQLSNAVSVAAAYNGEFGGVKVQVAGGYSTGEPEMSQYDNPEIWNAGLVLGFGAIKVGGTLGIGNDLNPGLGTWNLAGATEATAFELGATYTFGAAAVGVNWSRGMYEQADGEEDTLDHMQVSAGYQLGEGVRVGAFVGLFDYDDEGAADNDNSGWQTGVGINIGY